MTPDKLIKLVDDYACEVANAPSRPTPIERKLATERIERARNAVVTELAKPPPQPAWHDAPNAPGDRVIVGKGFKSELQTGITQQEIDRVSSWPGRWFGPLPEDTK